MAKYNAWPQEIIDYVREHGSAYSIQDMADLVSEKFGRPVTYGQMQSFYKNHKVHALPMKGRTRRGKFPEGTEAFMREIAPGRSLKEITRLVNARFGEGTMSVSQVRAYKKNHKIVSGYDSRFPKGHVPANKGKHMETRGRMMDTQFRKGHMPHNAHPIGTEIVRSDGYIQVKVADPDVWKLKHRIVWEQHNGPIPEGGLVVFRDGNRLNTDISNLALIDRSVNVKLNQMGIRHAGSPEMFDTAVLVARVAAEAGRKVHDKSKNR